MGVRMAEWDAREPEVVNPVQLADDGGSVQVESRLVFELVIPTSAEVVGMYQADF